MSVREIKAFERADGKRRVFIIALDQGRYGFIENGESYEECSKDFPWAICHYSGIYGTAEEAEQDARLTVPWLSESN
jgi:hypothetical protein